jgi:hypothetical protein
LWCQAGTQRLRDQLKLQQEATLINTLPKVSGWRWAWNWNAHAKDVPFQVAAAEVAEDVWQKSRLQSHLGENVQP